MSSPKSAETSPSPAPSSVGGSNAPKYGTVIPNRVFVGGISPSTTEQDLLELFSQYGTVKATKVINDRAGVSKGYGFVTFETEEEARRLTQEADNIMLKERKLNIAPAIKKQVTEYTGFMKAYSPRLGDGVTGAGGVVSNPAATVFFTNPSAAAAAAAAYYNQQQQQLLSAAAAASNQVQQDYGQSHHAALAAHYSPHHALHTQAALQNQAAAQQAAALAAASNGGSSNSPTQPQYAQAHTSPTGATFVYPPTMYYPHYQLHAAQAAQQQQQQQQQQQLYQQQVAQQNAAAVAAGWPSSAAAVAGGAAASQWRWLSPAHHQAYAAAAAAAAHTQHQPGGSPQQQPLPSPHSPTAHQQTLPRHTTAAQHTSPHSSSLDHQHTARSSSTPPQLGSHDANKHSNNNSSNSQCNQSSSSRRRHRDSAPSISPPPATAQSSPLPPPSASLYSRRHCLLPTTPDPYNDPRHYRHSARSPHRGLGAFSSRGCSPPTGRSTASAPLSPGRPFAFHGPQHPSSSEQPRGPGFSPGNTPSLAASNLGDGSPAARKLRRCRPQSPSSSSSSSGSSRFMMSSACSEQSACSTCDRSCSLSLASLNSCFLPAADDLPSHHPPEYSGQRGHDQCDAVHLQQPLVSCTSSAGYSCACEEMANRDGAWPAHCCTAGMRNRNYDARQPRQDDDNNNIVGSKKCSRSLAEHLDNNNTTPSGDHTSYQSASHKATYMQADARSSYEQQPHWCSGRHEKGALSGCCSHTDTCASTDRLSNPSDNNTDTAAEGNRSPPGYGQHQPLLWPSTAAAEASLMWPPLATTSSQYPPYVTSMLLSPSPHTPAPSPLPWFCPYHHHHPLPLRHPLPYYAAPTPPPTATLPPTSTPSRRSSHSSRSSHGWGSSSHSPCTSPRRDQYCSSQQHPDVHTSAGAAVQPYTPYYYVMCSPYPPHYSPSQPLVFQYPPTSSLTYPASSYISSSGVPMSVTTNFAPLPSATFCPTGNTLSVATSAAATKCQNGNNGDRSSQASPPDSVFVSAPFSLPASSATSCTSNNNVTESAPEQSLALSYSAAAADLSNSGCGTPSPSCDVVLAAPTLLVSPFVPVKCVRSPPSPPRESPLLSCRPRACSLTPPQPLATGCSISHHQRSPPDRPGAAADAPPPVRGRP